MTLEEIKQRADDFFNWPTERRDFITYTSAMIFAQKCADEAAANAEKRIIELETAIIKTLNENGHLADGDVCALIDLKRAMPTWELE